MRLVEIHNANAVTVFIGSYQIFQSYKTVYAMSYTIPLTDEQKKEPGIWRGYDRHIVRLPKISVTTSKHFNKFFYTDGAIVHEVYAEKFDDLFRLILQGCPVEEVHGVLINV